MNRLASRAGLMFPALYMALIFGLSSIPHSEDPETAIGSFFLWVPVNVQNFLHIPVFGGLCLLWCFVLENKVAYLSRRVMLAVALTVGYGFLDEWHQTMVPGRQGTTPDFMFDTLGAFSTAIVYAMFRIQRNVGVAD